MAPKVNFREVDFVRQSGDHGKFWGDHGKFFGSSFK